MFLEIYGFNRANYKYLVVFLFWVGPTLNRGGGLQPATPFRSPTQSSELKSGSSVQVPGLLSDIGVPSIISQKHATLARSWLNIGQRRKRWEYITLMLDQCGLFVASR